MGLENLDESHQELGRSRFDRLGDNRMIIMHPLEVFEQSLKTNPPICPFRWRFRELFQFVSYKCSHPSGARLRICDKLHVGYAGQTRTT